MILELGGVVADGTKPAGTIEPWAPFRQDIVLPRGEPLTIHLTVVGQNGEAFDLSAATIKLGVRQFRDDAAAKVTKQATNTDADEGEADITIPAAGTEALFELASYWYDIQLTDGAGARYQIVPFSAFRIAPIVNRSTDPNT